MTYQELPRPSSKLSSQQSNIRLAFSAHQLCIMSSIHKAVKTGLGVRLADINLFQFPSRFASKLQLKAASFSSAPVTLLSFAVDELEMIESENEVSEMCVCRLGLGRRNVSSSFSPPLVSPASEVIRRLKSGTYLRLVDGALRGLAVHTAVL